MEYALKEAQKHVGRSWEVPAGDGQGVEMREVVVVRELDGRVVCLIRRCDSRSCQIVEVGQIEEEILFGARRMAQRRKWDEEQAADDKQRDDEAAANLAKFAGFLQGMSPLQAARARKSLELSCLWTDRFLSRLDRIRELVADGARVQGEGSSRALALGDHTWSTGSLTNIGLDFAAHLIALRDGA